jgi:hypothetical protein
MTFVDGMVSYLVEIDRRHSNMSVVESYGRFLSRDAAEHNMKALVELLPDTCTVNVYEETYREKWHHWSRSRDEMPAIWDAGKLPQIVM